MFAKQIFMWLCRKTWASPVAQLVQNWPTNTGTSRDTSLISGSGRAPGEGNGKQLQYSCLGNSKDRGALQAIVHGGAKTSMIKATEFAHRQKQ